MRQWAALIRGRENEESPLVALQLFFCKISFGMLFLCKRVVIELIWTIFNIVLHVVIELIWTIFNIVLHVVI